MQTSRLFPLFHVCLTQRNLIVTANEKWACTITSLEVIFQSQNVKPNLEVKNKILALLKSMKT